MPQLLYARIAAVLNNAGSTLWALRAECDDRSPLSRMNKESAEKVYKEVEALEKELIALSNKEFAFEVGDIMAPLCDLFGKPLGPPLRSGASAYACAVIVQVRPLILVSTEGDMKWSCDTAQYALGKIGEADEETLERCMKRLKD